jgi:nucleoside-diphosphate-sugar epimerase
MRSFVDVNQTKENRMRVFVTGASGWIGSAVVPELLGAGHEVLGLARSDEAAAAIVAAGAEAFRGSLDDPAGLRDGVAQCDGVVHLGYNHDFSQMGQAAQTDRGVVEALGSVLKGSDRPFVVASGVLGLAPGRVATENDLPDPAVHPRIANVAFALSLADEGVRSSAVRFAPTVHGDGDHGFVATLVAIAREKGVSAYIGSGDNCWSAVHRFDAAELVRLTLEGAPAGTSVHAVAEQGIATRNIAEAIGKGLGIPVVSIPVDDAVDHFGWMGRFFGADATASNTITRELLNWNPSHQGLLEDLSEGLYFRDSRD